MKLDKNINSDGQGKYALVNVRKLKARLVSLKAIQGDGSMVKEKLSEAIAMLESEGILSWGNETPGDQFFVMKYKDPFTKNALWEYALEAGRAAADMRRYGFIDRAVELFEYSEDIKAESEKAGACQHKLPD